MFVAKEIGAVGPDEQYQSEGFFLRELFAVLLNSGIRFAVMRNYQTLPFSAGGSDLDIMIAAGDGARAKALVLEAIRSAGGVPLGLAESQGFFNVHALGRNSGHVAGWWGLRIDIYVGLFFRGQRLLDDNGDWPLCWHHGIPVLEERFAGVLGVLKELLNNATVPGRYAAAARAAAHQCWPQVESLLAPMGVSALARLRQLLFSDHVPSDLSESRRLLRQEIYKAAFAKGGFFSARQRVAYEWAKVRRYLRPSGRVLAILGVDGAGKSTVINAILPALNDATHNAVFVQHLRPTLLPPLSRLKGKKSQAAGPTLEPHGSTPSGKLGSLFRLVYLTLDYVLGYWFWTRPKLAKLPTVVIFDRYAYDMALDPRRFRISLPSWVARRFVALAPTPDLIICLYGSPELIAARKQELSVEETRRQVEALLAFAKQEPRAVLVSTDTSVVETRDAVLQAFCELLRARPEGRF
jgi:thymidylate kinase